MNASTNTALNNLVGTITPAQARGVLVTASDHLPIVVDYQVATPYNTWQLTALYPGGTGCSGHQWRLG